MEIERRQRLWFLVLLVAALLNAQDFATSSENTGTSSSRAKITIQSSRVFRSIDPNDEAHRRYLAQIVKRRPARDRFDLRPTTVTLDTPLMRIRDGVFQLLNPSDRSVKRSYKYLQASIDNHRWLHLEVHRDLNYRAPEDCIEHGRINTAKLYEDHGPESFDGWMRVRIPPNQKYCLIDITGDEGHYGLEIIDQNGTISFKQPERTEYEEYFLVENTYLLFLKRSYVEQFDMLLFDCQGTLVDRKILPGASEWRLLKDGVSENCFFLQWAPASVARFEIGPSRIQEKWIWDGMNPKQGMAGTQYASVNTIWLSPSARRILIAARKMNGYPPEFKCPGTFIFLDRDGKVVSEKDHDGWDFRGFVSEGTFVYQPFDMNRGAALEDGKFHVCFADCRTQETVYKYPVNLPEPPRLIGLNVLGGVIEVTFSRPAPGRNIPHLDVEVIQVRAEDKDDESGK